MSVNVIFKGTTYTIPSPGESNDWGAALNTLLVALGANQPTVQVVASGTAAIAPMRIAVGAAPTGPNVIGAMYMTTSGLLMVCVGDGSPGTWELVGSQREL